MSASKSVRARPSSEAAPTVTLRDRAQALPGGACHQPAATGGRALARLWRVWRLWHCCLGILALFLVFPLYAQTPLPSLLLVASERVTDPRFRETVVLVTRHGGQGAIGVILNRPLDIAVGKLFPALPTRGPAARPLFFGGPVAPKQLIFAYADHSPQGSDSLEVHPGVFLSHTPGLLAQLLRSSPPPTRLRVFAGHAGWAAGQLEGEIARGDWHLLPMDPLPLFTTDTRHLWSQLHRKASEKRTQAPSSLHVALATH